MKKLVPFAAHIYFWVTVLCVLLITIPFSSFVPSSFGLDLLQVMGCHSIFYCLILLLDVTSRTGAILVLVFTGLFALSLLVFYILAVRKKKYVPMGVVALADTVLWTYITVHAIAIYPDGFSEGHIPMLAGIVTGLVTAVILLNTRKRRITAS